MVEDMCIFNIVSNIRKLKASVTALVGKNASLTDQIEQIYMRRSTIYVDEDQHEGEKTRIEQFMERDYALQLKN